MCGIEGGWGVGGGGGKGGCFAGEIMMVIGLPGGLIIYQGHLFPLNGHLCAVLEGEPRNPQFELLQGSGLGLVCRTPGSGARTTPRVAHISIGPFFPGILLSNNPHKVQGKRIRFSKRTMDEKNGQGITP